MRILDEREQRRKGGEREASVRLIYAKRSGLFCGRDFCDIWHRVGSVTRGTKYRRHTDPNGGYDQNEIKRNKGSIKP